MIEDIQKRKEEPSTEINVSKQLKEPITIDDDL